MTGAKPGMTGDGQRFYVVGLAMFVAAAGLLLVRLLSYYLPLPENTAAEILVADTIFSVLTQIVIMYLATFLIYKLVLKMSVKEVFAFSNYRKTKWYNCLLAVPLGILALFVTVGLSTLWLIILVILGFTPGGGAFPHPEVFNPGFFILQILLTAVLPAVCEEFVMRGGLFTVMKKSYKGSVLFVLMGVAFGLFHQNIQQVFYASVFGGVMAFLMLKCKSVWPCVIVHFMNNFSSVYLDYAEKYGWFGGRIMPSIQTQMQTNFGQLMLLYIVVVGAFVGILVLFHYLNSVRVLKKKKETILDSGYNHTQNRVVLVGEENQEKVRELDMEQEVYGGKLPEVRYKPTLKDKAFFIGAIVITTAYTLFSFIFGLFY
jgi:membrane protease YdiL (CAAX protease family)